jgi:hypothetical protein
MMCWQVYADVAPLPAGAPTQRYWDMMSHSGKVRGGEEWRKYYFWLL